MPVFRHGGSILIVGGDSAIGKSLAGFLELEGAVVWSTTRHRELVSSSKRKLYLDLSEDSSTWELPPEKVFAAVFCAAITSTEECEQSPKSTRLINVNRTIALAKILSVQGSCIIFPSTNLVFDGQRELADTTDPVNPQTEYGRQKADAERQLLKSCSKVAIVRLGKVIAPNMRLFQKWIHDLKAGTPIHPFSDLVFAPVSLDFTVNILVKIIEEGLTGIIHATSSDNITYSDAAHWLANHINVNRELVRPVRGRDKIQSAFGHHAALKCKPFDRKLGLIGMNSLTTLQC